MASGFSFTITAFDKSTAVMRRINREFGNLARPVQNLNSAVKAFSKEAGLTQLGKSLQDTARGARDVVDNLGSIATPLNSILAAGSLAGLAAVADRWGDLGRQIKLTSQYTGIATPRIEALEGAARMAGISAETTSSALVSLQQSIEGAVYGRNQDFLALSNQLGLRLGRRGAVASADDVLGQVAASLQGRAPSVAYAIVDKLGLSSLAPLLINGREEVERYERSVRDLGYVQGREAVEAADRYKLSQFGVQTAVTGLESAIADRLNPSLTELNDSFSRWLALNRQSISSRLADGALAAGKAFASIAGGVESAGEKLGLWRDDADALVKFIEGGMIVAVGALAAKIGQLTLAFAASPLGRIGMAAELAYQTYQDPTWFGRWANEGGRKIGDSLMNWWNGPQAGEKTPGMQGPYGASQPTDSQGGKGKVDVQVTFHNAPPGTRATTRASGDAAASHNVIHALPMIAP